MQTEVRCESHTSIERSKKASIKTQRNQATNESQPKLATNDAHVSILTDLSCIECSAMDNIDVVKEYPELMKVGEGHSDPSAKSISKYTI